MQAALDGREVGLPGGEAVVQLLPLLLAKGAVRAVADGNGVHRNVRLITRKYRPWVFEIKHAGITDVRMNKDSSLHTDYDNEANIT